METEGTHSQEQNFTQTTEQVFDRFKEYLDKTVESLSTHLTAEVSGRSKRQERQAEGQSIKFLGNKDQFLFNCEIEDFLEETVHLVQTEDRDGALGKVRSAQSLLRQRQKKIKLADKSEAGWLAVKEYEAEELTSDSEDEKRIRKAQTAAMRKKTKEASQRGKYRRNPMGGHPSRFDPDDKQFFRGLLMDYGQ